MSEDTQETSTEEIELTEVEKREIALETVVHSMYNIYNSLQEKMPMLFPDSAGAIMDALYNTAEVRKDIEEYVTITMYDDDDNVIGTLDEEEEEV